MFKFFKKKTELFAPTSGKLIQMDKVQDAVFSEGMMGDGFAIEPTSNLIYAPLEGTVESIFPTKHAIVIKSKSGIEALVHMGIDTVELQGEGFTLGVKTGDTVTRDTLIAEIDFNLLKENEKENTIIVVFPDRKDFSKIPSSENVEAREVIGNIEA